MKYRMIKKIIGGLFLCVLCGFFYFAYLTHFEEKQHFKRKHTAQLYILKELDPGQNEPVFNTSLFRASKHVRVNKSRPVILPSYQLQNLREGRNKGPGLHKENLLRSVDIEIATKPNKASVNK